jgi:hypothetical protein
MGSGSRRAMHGKVREHPHLLPTPFALFPELFGRLGVQARFPDSRLERICHAAFPVPRNE